LLLPGTQLLKLLHDIENGIDPEEDLRDGLAGLLNLTKQAFSFDLIEHQIILLFLFLQGAFHTTNHRFNFTVEIRHLLIKLERHGASLLIVTCLLSLRTLFLDQLHVLVVVDLVEGHDLALGAVVRVWVVPEEALQDGVDALAHRLVAQGEQDKEEHQDVGEGVPRVEAPHECHEDNAPHSG